MRRAAVVLALLTAFALGLLLHLPVDRAVERCAPTHSCSPTHTERK